MFRYLGPLILPYISNTDPLRMMPLIEATFAADLFTSVIGLYHSNGDVRSAAKNSIFSATVRVT